MMQIDMNAIDRFILRMAHSLDTNFERKDDGPLIQLWSEPIALALLIYLPGAGPRLSNLSARSIHIDYDQIISAGDKICNRLASLFGKGRVVYARQTVVARVDKRITMDFLAEHHLQMAIPGKYRYGLYHDGELLSIAVFSGGRHMRDQQADYRSFELLRFCHKSGYRIVGGLSKLLKAFISQFHPADIMTYVDRDWAQESNLSTLGFCEKSITGPQRFLVENGVRRPTGVDGTTDEAHKNGLSAYFVSNSGSTKLVLTL